MGEVVDQNERQYFGLFPTIEGFVSAKASVKPNHRIEFVINRAVSGVNSDTAFSISSTVVENLVIYIEDFESYRYDEKEVNWNLLEGIAVAAPAIESKLNEDIRVSIRTLGGAQLDGKLLYVEDSSLILLQSSDKYNWRNVPLFKRSVHFSNIDNIFIECEGYVGEGLGYGALIGAVTAGILIGLNPPTNDYQALAYIGGGIITAGTALIGSAIGAIIGIDAYHDIQGNFDSYHDMLPRLKETAIFSSFPPPEIRQLQDSVLAIQYDEVVLDDGESRLKKNASTSNAIYVEILGNSEAFSGNYERRIMNNFSARIGIGYTAGGHGGGNSLTIPILAYYLINFGTSNIQLGAGATLKLNGQSAYATASIGYRYQPITHNSLMFEIALTPNFTYEPYITVGIGGGYTF